MRQIFLLSPANLGGKRAELLLRPEAEFALAQRVRASAGAELGEVFSFVSGLYFRGKLAYAQAFAAPPPDLPGALVITTGRGLLPTRTATRPEDIRAFSEVPIDIRDPRYREPLLRDLHSLSARMSPATRIILLGSIATSKYVELLLSVLGSQLYFPEPFIGMGDMQRGALMLNSARSGEELPYIAAEGAVRSRAAGGKRSSA